MKRTIGLVCEGPRDMEMLEDLLDLILPDDEISYRYLQPEPSLLSTNYNGWKGVLRWCSRSCDEIIKANDSILPGLDLLIIQMDGDVSRDEQNKQSHCTCAETGCDTRRQITKEAVVCIEDCVIPWKDCPIQYPCSHHAGQEPERYIIHLKELISDHLKSEIPFPVIISIPCDNMDAWIAAAFEEDELPFEQIEKPWQTVIAKKKTYHGIRVHKDQKSKEAYRHFRKGVVANWDKVRNRCSQAKAFQEAIDTATKHSNSIN